MFACERGGVFVVCLRVFHLGVHGKCSSGEWASQWKSQFEAGPVSAKNSICAEIMMDRL